jgi:hypothetical protein
MLYTIRPILLGLSVAVLGLPLNSHAAFKKVIDFYSIGNDSVSRFDDASEDQVRALEPSVGTDHSAPKSNYGAGMGLKFGLLERSSRWQEVRFGGSFGIGSGPAGEAQIGGTAGQYKESVSSPYLRVLAETEWQRKIWRRLTFSVGAGAGFFSGQRIHEIRVYDGLVGTTPKPWYDDEAKWRGFTWEIMPRISYVGPWGEFGLGMGYRWFPKLPGDRHMPTLRAAGSSASLYFAWGTEN